MKKQERELLRVKRLAEKREKMTLDEKITYLKFAISKLEKDLGATLIKTRFTHSCLVVDVERPKRKTTYVLPNKVMAGMTVLAIYQHLKEKLK